MFESPPSRSASPCRGRRCKPCNKPGSLPGTTGLRFFPPRHSRNSASSPSHQTSFARSTCKHKPTSGEKRRDITTRILCVTSSPGCERGVCVWVRAHPVVQLWGELGQEAADDSFAVISLDEDLRDQRRTVSQFLEVVELNNTKKSLLLQQCCFNKMCSNLKHQTLIWCWGVHSTPEHSLQGGRDHSSLNDDEPPQEHGN